MAVIYFKKTLVFLVLTAIIVFKPLYLFVFLFLFCVEYVFFIIYILKIFRNWDFYYVISIPEKNFSDESVLDVWFEYCKLQAFKKLYIILSKKGVGFKGLFVGFIIFFFSIPIRFLKLGYYFLNSPHSLRKGLELLYFKSFFILKDCKIEVLNRKIYLNCFTLGKFISNLVVSGAPKSDIVKAAISIKNASIEFSKFEQSKKEETTLRQMSFYDKDGEIIQGLHYGLVEKQNSMHNTSLIPYSLYGSVQNKNYKQYIAPAMNSMIKEGARKPGTIITEGVFKVEFGRKEKNIPSFEVDSIKFLYPKLFKLDPKDAMYYYHKNTTFEAILLTHLKEGYYRIDKHFFKEIANNNYLFALENTNEFEIVSEIDKFRIV